MTVDDHELQRLSRDLGIVTYAAQRNLRKAYETTARNVKDAWNEKLYSDGHAKLTGRSITYEIREEDRSGLEVEIGAVRGSGRQAGIVRLLENGSARNAPHGYGYGALTENEADLDRGIAKALRDAEGFL